MPLEELLDPELTFDDPESAGDNPTAYILKTDFDRLLEAAKAVDEWETTHVGRPGPFPIEQIRDAIAECEGS